MALEDDKTDAGEKATVRATPLMEVSEATKICFC
jgi:hypothetical protein